MHAGLAMGSIARCGSAEQRARWLPAMGRLERIGAFALTEPTGGSDVAAGLRTMARRDGGGWVLDGAKRWIGNATFADHVVVWARTPRPVRCLGFVVHGDNPGMTATAIQHKIALRGVQNADIMFTGTAGSRRRTGCRRPAASRTPPRSCAGPGPGWPGRRSG